MPEKGSRGFGSMDQKKQREIAKKGGESVPDEKRSFSRNHELAAEAGRKGGESVPDEKRSFSRNHDLAAEAGRKGGESVPNEKRSFSRNHELAAEAGRKGGEHSHGGRGRKVQDEKEIEEEGEEVTGRKREPALAESHGGSHGGSGRRGGKS